MRDERKAVFLSYASQDAAAAKRICEALRQAGVEVWFDQSELRGGDAWDAKIRKQIKECALFVPIISADTQARHEGYFRLEWRLADQRTHLMGKSKAFVVPVCIDDTRDADADVPDSFVAVQWTHLRRGSCGQGGGQPLDEANVAAFCARLKTLLGEPVAPVSDRRSELGAQTNAGQRPAPPRRQSARAWLAPAMIGAAVIAALALWQPWREKSAPPSTPTTVTVGPATEADQLAARARNRVVQSRDQLQVALDMAHRATDLADDSAKAWAVRARLDSLFILRGWDVSEQRREETQTLAKRALALDANATDAMLALAVVLQGQGAYAEVEALMRRAVVLAPDDALLRLALGDALSKQGKESEALAVRQETFQRFPSDPLAHYNLALSYEHAATPDFDAALRAFDDSIALQPYATTILHKVSLLAGWKGDLPAARRLLDGLDPLERTGDRAVGIAMVIGLLEHQPARTIEAGARTARVYLEDDYVRGPKAWSLAHAYAMEGKPSLAQAQWRAAAAVLRERLRATPDDWYDQAGLGVTLAWLGERDEAEQLMAPLESVARESPQSLRLLYLAHYHAGLGDAPGAASWLQRIVNRQELVTSKTLSLDPWWDKVRAAPEFQALLMLAQNSGSNSSTEETAADSQKIAPDPKSVVVLPFANLSGDPAQEYFSDGLTEEILNALARERDLRVVPRTSAFSFKGKNLPLPEIARALNVAQVVEGSVQRAGNIVRIDCTLTRVSDGFAQPLPQFQREMKDASGIFALEDEVARAVVGKLTQRTATTAPVEVLTKNSDAYDAYLRGRDLMNQTSPSWPKAVEALRRAVELDPQFALAWADLGQLSASLYVYGFDGAALAAGGHAIDEALRLQPDLPEAHFARAVYLRDFNAPPAAVERELALAESMRPDAPDILEFRSSVEFARGDEESGLKLMQRAVDLDPRNGVNLNALGNQLTAVGRYAEAETIYAQAFQILGSSIPLTNRARVYFLWKGDRALAARTLDEAPEEIRDERYWTSRALLLYAMGDQSGALAAAAHMRPRSEFFRIRALFTAKMRGAMGDATGAHNDYLAALPLAEEQQTEFPALPEPDAILGLVYAGLGRKAEALAAARKAIEVGGPTPVASRGIMVRTGLGAVTLVDLELDPFAALAQIQARFGMTDEALAIVKEAVAAGRWRRNYLLNYPDWAILREDPRFQAIVAKAPL